MYFSCALKSLAKNAGLMQGKKIVLFGAGGSTADVSAVLLLMSVDAEYFVDNNPAKWQTVFEGKPVKAPQELVHEDKNKLIIIVASVFYPEIAIQLKSMCFIENVHFFDGLFSESKPEKYGFSVGKHSYGYQQFCYDGVPLSSIGAFCSIADKVYLQYPQAGGGQIINMPNLIRSNSLALGSEGNEKVVIGNDVWIGANVTILAPSRIGNGAVIGAGAVITSNVPDYAIVVGKPARVIKKRFAQTFIDRLNSIAWWDWPDEKIKEHFELFFDVKRFTEFN